MFLLVVQAYAKYLAILLNVWASLALLALSNDFFKKLVSTVFKHGNWVFMF